MKKIVRLTERDLTRIVKRVIMEQSSTPPTTTPNTKNIKPEIEIDCSKRVIVNSQLPKLDATANNTIINHYCNK
jgi:hypothetical protein